MNGVETTVPRHRVLSFSSHLGRFTRFSSVAGAGLARGTRDHKSPFPASPPPNGHAEYAFEYVFVPVAVA